MPQFRTNILQMQNIRFLNTESGFARLAIERDAADRNVRPGQLGVMGKRHPIPLADENVSDGCLFYAQ